MNVRVHPSQNKQTKNNTCTFLVVFDWLDAPPERITGADIPMPYTHVLEDLAMVKSSNIANAVRRVCYRQK